MDYSYFRSALNSLKKPQDKRRLVQILTAIKKELDNHGSIAERLNVINELGRIKVLVTCLQHESSTVIDLTLSILGNCCTFSNIRRELVSLNILHIINRVLEKHDKDSIYGRVFRIIGNLCADIHPSVILLKEPSLIDKIALFLKKVSKTNFEDKHAERVAEASVIMAIRTMRKLLKGNTVNSLISKHKFLEAIGQLLIKYTKKWQSDKQNESILQDILRVIDSYAKHHCNDTIATLKHTENGDSLECLVPTVVLDPLKVTDIVINLHNYCTLKSDIPVQAICDSLLSALKGSSDENCCKYLHGIRRLATFTYYLQYLRSSNCILQLVDELNNRSITNANMEYCILILSILKMCEFDRILVSQQIQGGIIGTLVTKLEKVSGQQSSSIVHRNCKRKKRKFLVDSNFCGYKRLKYLTEEAYEPQNLSPPRFFLRCTSPTESSESSSGPSSPDTATVAEDVCDSDNYSPVCSDAEDTDMSLPSLSPIHSDYLSSDEDYSPFKATNNHKRKEREKYKLLGYMFSLLYVYTQRNPIPMDLINTKLIYILINISINLNCCPSIPQRLVEIILSSQEALMPLMLTDFIQNVYNLKMADHSNCSECRHVEETANRVIGHIQSVAESGGGKGDIAHQLLRANIDVKQKLLLNVPYVIKTKQTLSKLMLNCGGLKILMKLLQEKSDLQEKSIKCLCVMAIHHLNIKSPVTCKTKSIDERVTGYELSETCENVVSFKLDDGSIVKADRDFLTQHSDYFSMLLCGHFKESAQTEVSLQSVTNKSLNYLLSMLQNKITQSGSVDKTISLEVYLELIELTERYLMVELNVYLTGCVEQIYITTKTVPTIYQWSIESGTNILRVESVAFALAGDVLDSDRFVMFQNLFDLGYSEHLVDDIEKLLGRFLR